ncbi:hypothetical protein [Streptomyces sp. NPDC050504]|uniref:hypothetical protein n=1 Tax=Streptomyces sp. NPDC050504 TaxID=3365618 RepID=UPI00379D3433
MYFDENEPQSVREERFAAPTWAERRAARGAARLDLRAAHVGAAIVTVVLVVLGWAGKPTALAVVGGIFLLWFAIALTWAHIDEDRGRHALQRAYNATFGWADNI